MITGVPAGQMSKYPDIWRDWRGIVAITVYLVPGKNHRYEDEATFCLRLWFVGWDCDQPD